MNKIWKIIQFCSDKMKAIAAISLMCMTLLTCVDIVGRFFKHPVFGSVELVSFMGILGVVLALPYAHDIKSHIGVEIFVSKLSLKKRSFVDMITGILSFAFFSLVTWRMFDYAVKMMDSGEVSMNLELPEYLIIFVTGFCFIVFSLFIIKGIVENFKGMRGK